MNNNQNTNNMSFSELLNYYLRTLNCNQKALSSASGVHSAIIGKFRTSEVIPKENSIQIERLINGITIISKEKNIESITREEVSYKIYNSIKRGRRDFEAIRDNLNSLIETLNISGADLSRFLRYDNSFLSKIRNGTRKPSSVDDFIKGVVKYVVNYYKDEESLKKILFLTNKTDFKDIYIELEDWLFDNAKRNEKNSKDKMNAFLKEIDNFKISEYLKTLDFSKINMPNNLNKPTMGTFYGIEKMKEAELNFFQGTILSNSREDIFMCSDMEMVEMMKDRTFGKLWMMALANVLKKGLNINIVHNLNRPFNEMMTGLELWIPIYMTGQVRPYYLKKHEDKYYSHTDYISGEYALSGECIVGKSSKGKYSLTNDVNELNYYKEKSKSLLEKATPLMEIYTENNYKELISFYRKDCLEKGNRIRLLSTLPFHTIDDKLFDKILRKNKIPAKQRKTLKEYLKEEREYINELTTNNTLIDRTYLLSKEDFISVKPTINIAKYDNRIQLNYTYEDYLEHYNNSTNNENSNYKLIIDNKQIFNNIDVYLNPNKYVIISKKNNPYIHFIIKHEKLVESIERFIDQEVYYD